MTTSTMLNTWKTKLLVPIGISLSTVLKKTYEFHPSVDSDGSLLACQMEHGDSFPLMVALDDSRVESIFLMMCKYIQ